MNDSKKKNLPPFPPSAPFSPFKAFTLEPPIYEPPDMSSSPSFSGGKLDLTPLKISI